MNNTIEQIVKAINTKKQISFYVNDNQVLGNPCALYVDGDRHNNNDVVLLDLFQTAGHSRMGGLPTMKIYKVSEITEITVLDERPCFDVPAFFKKDSLRYSRKLAVLMTPAPRLKVWDWVYNKGVYGKLIDIDTLKNVGSIETSDAVYADRDMDSMEKIARSEVKVTLTLEGTVCRSEDSGSLHDTHFYLHFPGADDDKDDDRWALVSFNLLSPAQAEMVRELVEG